MISKYINQDLHRESQAHPAGNFEAYLTRIYEAKWQAEESYLNVKAQLH